MVDQGHARRAGRDLCILNAGDAELLAHIQLLVAARPAALAETALDKGAIYKVLANRVHLGETVHKGVAYPESPCLGYGARLHGRPAHDVAWRPEPRYLHS